MVSYHVAVQAAHANQLSLLTLLSTAIQSVNGPCLLDYLILKLRLPVVLYVSFAVGS